MSRKAKEAIKTAVAMTLAYGIALSQGWDKPMWAGFSVAFVSLGTIGQSIDKATLRMVGTCMAAAVTFLLLGCFAQDRWLFLLGLSGWVGYCTYMSGGSRYPYFWQVGAFVCVIVSLEAGFNAAKAFQTAVERIQETGLGILVYTLVSLLLWPVNAGPEMREAAKELVQTQRKLFEACLDLIRGGDPAATRALRTKARQQQSLLSQLLGAAATDSIEVQERRSAWRAFEQQTTALNEAIERCCDAVFGHGLDVERLLPSLPAFQDEITRRFDAIVDALRGEAAGFERSESPPSMAPEEGVSSTHFQRAALTAATMQLLEIEALTRMLYGAADSIRGDGKMTTNTMPTADRVFVYDPDRLLAVARVMLIQWIAYLAVIYIPDIPSGVGVAILTGSSAITAALTPQLSPSTLIVPGLISSAFAGAVYMLVMPHLSSFLGLGLVIFAVTFAVCYLFAAPQQTLGRTLGLATFVLITSISNEQRYSFFSFSNTALMLTIALIIISVGSYVPSYLRPDRMVLRLLERLFRSSAHTVRAVATGTPEASTTWSTWKQAFHAHELATIPEKIEAWKPWVDTKALRGTSTDQIQALADSGSFLSRTLTTLAAQKTASPAAETALGDDLRAWHETLQQALEKLSDDPSAAGMENARERLVEIVARLEARARDAVNAGDGSASHEADRLYLLLAAYRSVSEALVDYVEKASSIDWTRWYEERFA